MHNKKSTDSDLWLHNPTLNCCMCLNIKSLKGKKFMEKVTKKQAPSLDLYLQNPSLDLYNPSLDLQNPQMNLPNPLFNVRH